ncbi:MAG: hypothetical protein ACREJX_01960, partial [Polyangiaceae bacterium]
MRCIFGLVAASASLLLFGLAACGGDDSNRAASDASLGDVAVDSPAAPEHTITLSFSRTVTGFDVTMHVETNGVPDSSSAPTISVTGGAASAVVPGAAAGDFVSSVDPSVIDDEVAVTATAYGNTAKKTALVLEHLADALDQPEEVPGLVNTTGVEDGANVSPDGAWLIVASYVPIDLYSCVLTGAADFSSAACSTIIGPYAAPERPNMLGASRIHDGTYDDTCPSLGVTTPQTHAFFPVAAYMFHRQSDGSFAEPHVLGVDADGCLGPYGYSFAGAPTGTTAGLVFAHDDPSDVPDTKADIYFLNATLGQDNIWARYFVDGGTPTLSEMTAVKIPPVLPDRQGNPAFQDGLLAWDDEDLAVPNRDLFFAPEMGTLPAVTAIDAGSSPDGGPPTIGVSNSSEEEIQPAFDGADLYWYGTGGISMATRTSSTADPSAPASWSARTSMVNVLGDGTRPIIATGEPTVAHPAGGKKELYFVYIKKVGAGYDGAVAR